MISYRDKLNKAKGSFDFLSKMQKDAETKKNKSIEYLHNLELAQIFLQTVAQDTQEQLKIHIKDIVQLAIDTCWPDEIEFDIMFEIKRGKTEAKLIFRNIMGDEVNPYDADGGGLSDIASIGLRIAGWSLGSTDNVIILDEPFKNLGKLKIYGAEILKELSHRLNIQFIVITHDDTIVDVADKVIVVDRKKCDDGYYRSYIS